MERETSYENIFGTGDRQNIIQIFPIGERRGGWFSKSIDTSKLVDGINDEYKTRIGINRWKIGEYVEIHFQKQLFIDEMALWVRGSQLFGLRLEYFNIKTNNWESIRYIHLLNKNGTNRQAFSFSVVKTRKLRLIRISGDPTNYVTSLTEIEFKNLEVPVSTLIKKDSQYGYYTDSFQSLGITYPTKEQFEQYGMKDLSILEAGDIPVEYEMELISETDEEKCFSYSFDLNGRHENMKSIDGITIK